MSQLKNFEVLVPSSLKEAISLLKQHPQAMIIAGGTDLVAKLKRGQFQPTHLISLGHFSQLCKVETRGDVLVLGSLLTLRQLADEPAIEPFSAFQQALSQVASPTLRQSATLGGNLLQDSRCKFVDQSELWREGVGYCMKTGGPLCRVAPGLVICSATFCSDLAPALVVLGAKAVFEGPEGQRKIELEKLYHNDGMNHIKRESGEILVEVEIPFTKTESLYQKLCYRHQIDFPDMGMALSWIEQGEKWDVKVAFTALSSHIYHFEKKLPRNAEAVQLWGQEIFKRLKPRDTLYFPPLYRKEMAVKFLVQALENLLEKSKC